MAHQGSSPKHSTPSARSLCFPPEPKSVFNVGVRDNEHVAHCHVTLLLACTNRKVLSRRPRTRGSSPCFYLMTNNCVLLAHDVLSLGKLKFCHFTTNESGNQCEYRLSRQRRCKTAKSCRSQLNGIKILKFDSEGPGRYDAQDKHLTRAVSNRHKRY